MPAGGGRGKGGGLSFSTESLGFGRGEVLPSAVLSPPPTFPPLNNKPVKLETENEFLLTKSTELRNYFRSVRNTTPPLKNTNSKLTSVQVISVLSRS